MSYRGREDSGNSNKMELGEPRRFGGMDDKQMDDADDRRFDSGRGRRPPPFGRGRRMSPSPRDRPRDYGYGHDDPPMMRDRSPMRHNDDRFSDRYKKDDGNFPKREDNRKDMGRFYGENRFMEGRPRMADSNFNSRFDSPRDDFKPRGQPFSSPPAPQKPFISEGFPKPNECEIIAVNRQQRGYAESVENRIKSMGVLVDVLFLKDEALLTQTIDDIARRGSLYAMVISPQNETHNSVTVNILHGTPQEHRNMPLEDALKLVSRNFHDYIRVQKESMERERAERGQYDGSVAADKEIQFLLRMLADGRCISIAEINSVITYLTERRDKMQANPGEDRGRRQPLPSMDNKLDIPFKAKDNVDVAQKEQDLQNRIINIMNQGAPQQTLGGPRGASGVGESSARPSQAGLNSMRPASAGASNISGIKSTPIASGADDLFSKPSGMAPSSGRGESTKQSEFSSTGAKIGSDSSAASTFLNFNNPSVQKALDNLMQSGPNILKNISLSSSAIAGVSPLDGGASKPSGGAGPNDSLGMQRGAGPNDSLGMQRGGMGPNRGSGGMPDMPAGSNRGSGNMDMPDMGSQRGPGGPDMMGGPQRGGYGGMSDMGGMNRGYGGGGNLPESGGMGQRMKDMGGRMGGPSQGMGLGAGNQYGSGPNQFGKFQGAGGQQGNFPGGSYNNPNMGNLPRQNFGGNQGMGGGGPRRY